MTGDKTYEFSAFNKINQLVAPTLLTDEQLLVFQNGELKRYGDVGLPAKRNGIETYNPNQVIGKERAVVKLYEHAEEETKFLFAKSNDGTASDISYCDVPYTGTWNSISATEVEGVPSFASMLDTLYIGNRNSGEQENQVFKTTYGMVRHGLPPCFNYGIGVSKGTSGNLTADKGYVYVIVFVYDNYMEGGANGYVIVDLDGSEDEVTLSSIPLGNSRCTARKIYRSEAFDFEDPVTLPDAYIYPQTLYYLATINDNITTTYNDKAADINLEYAVSANELTTYNDPYKAKKLLPHENRLFGAYLRDNALCPIPTSDITLTAITSVGSMTTGTYKYRFYKRRQRYTGGNKAGTRHIDEYGLYAEKSVTLSGGNNAVRIEMVQTTAGVGVWFDRIIVTRTKVGGTQFFSHPNLQNAQISTFNPLSSGFTDTIADASLDIYNWLPVPEVTRTAQVYPRGMFYSEYDEADKVRSTNFIEIGSEETGEITEIFSEQNRVIVFQTNSIHTLETVEDDPQFWRQRKLISRIGAEGAVQIADGRYFFYTYTDDTLTFYKWEGYGEPKQVGLELYEHLSGAGYVVRSIEYDRYNNHVVVSVNDTHITELLRYDLDFDTWYIALNDDTDLAIWGMVNTESYGLLFGDSYGFLLKTGTGFQDAVGPSSTATDFEFKLRTKIYNNPNGALKIRRFWMQYEASTNGSSNELDVTYAINNGASTTQNLETIASGVQNVKLDKVSPEAKDCYVEIKNKENLNLIIRNFGFIIRYRHIKK